MTGRPNSNVKKNKQIRQKKRWRDNIQQKTHLNYNDLNIAQKASDQWRRITHISAQSGNAGDGER